MGYHDDDGDGKTLSYYQSFCGANLIKNYQTAKLFKEKIQNVLFLYKINVRNKV